MELKYLDRRFALEDVDEAGVLSGHASIFGVEDAVADVVAPGAFSKSLEKHRRDRTMPKMLWQHDAREPIGVWHEIVEDEIGLFVRGRLVLDVRRGREAHALMRSGALDGLSIGFQTLEAVTDPKSGVRTLTEVHLQEVSPVTFPALAQARVTTVKAAGIRTKRDFEHALREAGFSRRDALWLASQWSPPARRDAGEGDLDDLAARLRRAAGILTPP